MKEIYEVTGTCTITVKKRVLANSPEEAYEKVTNTFNGINEYCGNGGDDKLIGVENISESVFADCGYVEWDENDIVITDDDRIDEDEEDEDDDYYDEDDEWEDEDDEWED